MSKRPAGVGVGKQKAKRLCFDVAPAADVDAAAPALAASAPPCAPPCAPRRSRSARASTLAAGALLSLNSDAPPALAMGAPPIVASSDAPPAPTLVAQPPPAPTTPTSNAPPPLRKRQPTRPNPVSAPPLSAGRFTPGDPVPTGDEQWYSVGDDFPDALVSTKGRIYNGKRIAPSSKQIRLPSISGPKTAYPRVLVCCVFYGPMPPRHKIAIADKNPANAHPSNLSYQPRGEVVAIETRLHGPNEPLPPDFPEQWRLVGPEFPGVSASTLGRIHNGFLIVTQRNRLKNGQGYVDVIVINNFGKRKIRMVHMLVARAFLGPKPEGRYDVAHADDDRTNFKLSNLSYQTKSDNNKQAQGKRARRILATTVDDGEADKPPRTLQDKDAKEAGKRFGKSKARIRKVCDSGYLLPLDGRLWRLAFLDPPPNRPPEPVPDGLTGWREIPDFPKYECLPDGRIRRKTRPQFFLAQTMNGEYLGCSLQRNREQHTVHIHVMICSTFHGPRPTPLHEANHLDENQLNNHERNLVWTDKNIEYSCGKPCEAFINGQWEWFASRTDAEKKTGANAKGISAVIAGTYQTSGGYIWRAAARRRENAQ